MEAGEEVLEQGGMESMARPIMVQYREKKWQNGVGVSARR